MMESLVIYIIKSGGLVSIFFFAYLLLLKNDTSFQLNRWFFIVGFIVSFVLPAVEFTRSTVATVPAFPSDFTSIPAGESGAALEAQSPVNWWLIAGCTYLSGVVFILLQLIVRLFSLQKFLRRPSRHIENGFVYLTTDEKVNPFSFFRYIVYNRDSHSSRELIMILEHERVHASQWHSADVLLAHLGTGLLWFNPLAWLYKKYLLQNLEYIADRETAKVSTSTKDYQKALIRISIGDLRPLLANHFYQSLIKKRILMLNKKSTSKNNFWKTGLILPLLFIFFLGFQVKTEARMVSSTQIAQDSIRTITEFSVTIDSHSSEESLAEATGFLRDRGITLQFDNIQRTDEGVITRIEASFQTQKAQNGNYNQTNGNGISPFMFYMKESGETGFKAAEAWSSKDTKPFQKIGKEPLVILNDKKYQTTELYGKYILVKKGFEVLSPEATLERFGRKLKDGALIIHKGELLDNFEGALNNLSTRTEGIAQEYIFFMEDMQPSYVTAQKALNKTVNQEERKNTKSIYLSNATFTPDSSSFIQKWSKSKLDTSHINTSQFGASASVIFSSNDRKKPLIVIDGKIQEPDSHLSSIDPHNIEKLEVLREEKAIEKYGEKGKNGAIEISMKNEGSTTIYGNVKKETTNSATRTIHIRSSNNDASNGEPQSITIVGAGTSHEGQSSALYVVDGEEMKKDFNASTIDPEEIKSINVIKGDNAVEQYGQKAGQGVIEITTKKED